MSSSSQVSINATGDQPQAGDIIQGVIPAVVMDLHRVTLSTFLWPVPLGPGVCTAVARKSV